MALVWVQGISGSGKSSVCEMLKGQGLLAIDSEFGKGLAGGCIGSQGKRGAGPTGFRRSPPQYAASRSGGPPTGGLLRRLDRGPANGSVAGTRLSDGLGKWGEPPRGSVGPSSRSRLGTTCAGTEGGRSPSSPGGIGEWPRASSSQAGIFAHVDNPAALSGEAREGHPTSP
jgi:hypothetical protein